MECKTNAPLSCQSPFCRPPVGSLYAADEASNLLLSLSLLSIIAYPIRALCLGVVLSCVN